MQASELLQRIESKSAPLIIDPRSEIEFKRGHSTISLVTIVIVASLAINILGS
jgi:hypothetical protein